MKLSPKFLLYIAIGSWSFGCKLQKETIIEDDFVYVSPNPTENANGSPQNPYGLYQVLSPYYSPKRKVLYSPDEIDKWVKRNVKELKNKKNTARPESLYKLERIKLLRYLGIDTTIHSTIYSKRKIYLLPGTYSTAKRKLGEIARPEDEVFVCQLEGATDRPIILLTDANNPAIIDGGIRIARSSCNIVLRNICITNSRKNLKVNKASGIDSRGYNIHIQNCTITNVGHPGIGSWSNSKNDSSSIYGCLIAHNGIYDSQRSVGGKPWIRGSGIYVQNTHGTKMIKHNVSRGNYTLGMKAYAESVKSGANNVLFIRNVIYENGHINDNNASAFMVASRNRAVTNCRINGNFFFMRNSYVSFGTKTDSKNYRLRLGYQLDKVPHSGIELSNNYFVQGGTRKHKNAILYFSRVQNAVVSNNTFITNYKPLEIADTIKLDTANNTWRKPSRSSMEHFIVRNEIDSTRIWLIVYNWKNQQELEIPLQEIWGNNKKVKISDKVGNCITSTIKRNGKLLMDAKQFPLPLPMEYGKQISNELLEKIPPFICVEVKLI